MAAMDHEDGEPDRVPVLMSGTTFTTDAVGNLTKIDPPGTTSDRAYAYDAYSRMTCAEVARPARAWARSPTPSTPWTGW